MTPQERKVIELALEALWTTANPKAEDAIKALEKALAQPEQEPVAWMNEEMDCIFFDTERPEPFAFDFWKPLYTTPPQRKPLPPKSPCEMTQVEGKMFKLGWLECEAAHNIKE